MVFFPDESLSRAYSRSRRSFVVADGDDLAVALVAGLCSRLTKWFGRTGGPWRACDRR